MREEQTEKKITLANGTVITIKGEPKERYIGNTLYLAKTKDGEWVFAKLEDCEWVEGGENV